MKIDSPTFLTETTFISASVQFSSGSQKFGDTTDDTHQFTGSLFISGSRIDFVDGKSGTKLGKDAGLNTGTGTENTYIGNQAGKGGSGNDAYNTGIGSFALHAITDGNSNVAVGIDVGTALTTGDNNMLIGRQAGNTMTGTSNTILIGYGAGTAINSTDANGTVAIGYQALNAITSPAGNTAIGYQAGHELVTGHSNTFVGYEAGGDFDSGESNMTAIGRNAMGSADNGSSSNCVAIGVDALEGGTGVIISNVAIGNDAMSNTVNRQAVGNIAIGHSAMDSTFGGTLTNVIAIGRDSMHHASNQLNGETGAIGIGMLVANKLNKPFVYVRADRKKHGRKNSIEGFYEKSQTVVVIEDLISTGNSSLEACQSLISENLKIKGLISIFNYNFEISKLNFESKNISYSSLCSYNYLIDYAVKNNYVSDVELTQLIKWRNNPQEWNK